MTDTLRVLYVDDEPGLLEIGKMFLEESGDFSVTTIDSATAALDLLLQENFDAIISDYQMPGMDGIGFLKSVRASGNAIPFILFTGRGREEVVIQALNSGADFYLQKGGEPESQFAELSHKIRMAVERLTTSEAFKVSETRLRTLIENASDIIRILDRDGLILFDTSASEHLLGYPPGFTIGKSPMEFINPDDLEMVKQELSQVYTNTNTGVPTEFRLRRADGSYTWVESVGKNLTGVPGINGIMITTRFIDERKHAEEALRQSEEKLKKAEELGGAGSWYSDTLSGELGWSDNLQRLFGYTPGTVRPTPELFRSHIYPDDLENVEALIRRSFEQDISYNTEFRYVPKNGSVRWASATAKLFHDSAGTPTGFDGFFQDITERKRVEDSLRTLTTHLLHAQKIANVGSFDFNIPENTVVWSDEMFRVFGHEPQASPLNIEQVREMIHPEDRELQREQTDKIMETGSYEFEHRLIRPDGDIRWIAGRAEMVEYDAAGAPVRMLGTVQDITERKRAEEALRDSEQKYRMYIDHSPESVFIVDADGNYKDVNPSACSMLGYSREEFLTLSIRDMVPPDNPTSSLSRFSKLKETGMLRAELLLVKKTGDLLPVILNSVSMPDGRYLGFCTDITERKQAEETLNEAQARTATVLEGIADTFYSLDDKWRFTTVNPAAEKAPFGRPASEMLGKVIWELYPGLVGTFIQQHYFDAAKNFSLEHYEGQSPLNGRWYEVFMQGRRGGVDVYMRDISERKWFEEAIRESRQVLETIINNIPARVFWKDKNLTFLGCNTQFARDAGFEKPEEVIGKDDYTMGWREQAELYRADDRLVIESGRPRLHIEEPQTTPSGEKISLLTSKVPLKDANGEISGVLGTYVDITDRKRVEVSLREANKKLTLLSGITRHDINNQLTVLIGHLRILEKKQPDSSFAEHFKKINAAAKRISAMIRFTREYEEIGVKAPIWHDCRTLTDKAAREVPLGKVIVKNDLPTGAKVFADPLIVKVFYNLMDNAVRYGGKITTIRFSIEESGGDQLIVCEDDGEGIPFDEKEKIFERGFGKNTGLGLALSREILDITGITIKETGEPGKGARFEITVPKGMWR